MCARGRYEDIVRPEPCDGLCLRVKLGLLRVDLVGHPLSCALVLRFHDGGLGFEQAHILVTLLRLLLCFVHHGIDLAYVLRLRYVRVRVQLIGHV